MTNRRPFGHVRRSATAVALALVGALLVPAFQAPASAAPGEVDASIEVVTPPPAGPLVVGRPFRFTVAHRADLGGADPVSNTSTITYVVPDEFRVDGAEAQGSTDYRCPVVGQTITCALEAFSSVSSFVDIRLTPRAVGNNVVSTLSIATNLPEPSPDPTPNQISFTRNIVASTVDLGVAIYAPPTAKVGDAVAVNTFVYAPGPGTVSEAIGSTLVQEVPDAVRIDDVTIVRQGFDPVWGDPLAASGSCSVVGQTVTCSNMDLTYEGQYVVVSGTAIDVGSYSTTATLATNGTSQTEVATNPTPNSASAEINVTSGTLPSALSGRVTDATAAAVVGADVAAFEAADSSTPTATATTGASGTYAFAALPVGTYRLRITPPSGSPLPVQWSGAASTRALASERKVLGSGAELANVDLQLVDTGAAHVDLGAYVWAYPAEDLEVGNPLSLYFTISNTGRVVDGASVAAAADVQAVAQVPAGFTIGTVQVVDPSRPGTPVAGTCPVSGQTVTCTGLDLEVGGYRWVVVEATPTVGGAALTAELSVSSATQGEVVVDPNPNTASLSLRVTPLSDPSVVSGTVLGSGGAPLEGVAVWAYLPTDGFVPPAGALTATDAQGHFTFPALAPGSYALRFGPPASSPYVPQWAGGRATRDTATPVVVDGSGDPIDASEAFTVEMGSVTGTVRGNGGSAASGVTVQAFVPGVFFFPASSAVTAADGTYQLTGLRQDTPYEVVFRPSGPSGLAAEWFDDSASRGGATTVEVVDGVLGGVDADLVSTGSVSGTVTGSSGAPLGGVRVVLFGPSDTWAGSFETVTASDGTYLATGIRPASYQVRFVAPTGSGLSAQWFDGTTIRGASTPVVVSLGGSTPAIDASWAP